MSGVLLALGVLVALAVSGAGIALCLPRGRRGVVGLAFEAMVIGLVVQEAIALMAVRTGHYSRLTVFVLTLLVVVASFAAWFLIRARSAAAVSLTPQADLDPDPDPEPDVGAGTRLTTTITSVGLLVVVAVALVLRQGPSYFIFQTGDMGEYVNRANIVVNAGKLSSGFPHGFVFFLANTNLLFGRAHTVAGLPALGVLLLLGVFVYARLARLHPFAALGAAALVAVLPVTVWFSMFPVSEALYATLLIAALYFVLRARADSSIGCAVVAGLILGLMLLVRGNAMLLAPVVVLGLFGSAAVDHDRALRIQRVFTIVALLALSAAYAYDVYYPRTYFVQTQLHSILPASVFRMADKLDLLRASIPLLLAVVVAVVVVLRLAVLITRYTRPRFVEQPQKLWRIAYGTVVVLMLLGLVFIHRAGLVDALARWGLVLVVVSIVGLLCLVFRPGRYIDGVDGWMLVLVVCFYTLLFAGRVPASKPHAYYLYYDRYLFSEVLPAALVLAAVGFHFFVEMFVNAKVNAPRSKVVTRVALVALGGVALVAVVPNLKETHRITRYPLFGNSYQTLHRLDVLTTANGKGGAVVYSASPVPPAGWFFENTFRAFALPLGLTFDRIVVGIPSNPFGKDVQLTPAAALAKLQREGFKQGYLVSLRAPGVAAPVADGPHTRYIATVDYVSPTLSRSVKREPAQWQRIAFHFDVYALS